MQKCKYLDDLGIPINEYGTNFITDDELMKRANSKDSE